MIAMQETQFTLEVGDCVERMKTLADGAVDLVVTSPPYNLGIKCGKYEDRKSREDYLNWSCQWASEVKRVLAEKGSFFLNVGASPSNPLLPHELVVILKTEVGFVLQNTFHWIKSITVDTKEGKQVSAGHFKPIQSGRFVNDCHEYIFHLTKHGDTPLTRLALGVPYMDKSNIRRWAHTAGRDVRCRGNNWFIPYKTIVSRSKQRPHPATFPVELAVNCIKIHGVKPGMVMLDPFVGIGHSAVAAKECNVPKFIGYDIDADYLEVAKAAGTSGFTKGSVKPLKPVRRNKTQQQSESFLF
jgi:site-specific DNA-methyltransferase (adenine-specific)